jgi:hypothetical protein
MNTFAYEERTISIALSADRAQFLFTCSKVRRLPLRAVHQRLGEHTSSSLTESLQRAIRKFENVE